MITERRMCVGLCRNGMVSPAKWNAMKWPRTVLQPTFQINPYLGNLPEKSFRNFRFARIHFIKCCGRKNMFDEFIMSFSEPRTHTHTNTPTIDREHRFRTWKLRSNKIIVMNTHPSASVSDIETCLQSFCEIVSTFSTFFALDFRMNSVDIGSIEWLQFIDKLSDESKHGLIANEWWCSETEENQGDIMPVHIRCDAD